MKEFKKPKYPFAMYSYVDSRQGELVYDRKIITSDIDEFNFLQKNNSKKVIIDKLSKEEIKTLPFITQITYKTPKWVYIVIWIFYTVIIWVISKYFT